MDNIKENLTDDSNNDILEESKKEDKKYIKKYLAIMILCTVFGGFLGIACMRIIKSGGSLSAVDFFKNISNMITMISPFIMLFISVASGMFIFILYGKSRRLYEDLNSEDENVINKIEKSLSICMIVLNCTMVIYYIMLAVYTGDLFNINIDNDDLAVIFAVRFFSFIISFILFMSVLHISQKKIVDFAKIMNPEKKGSVYDMNFNKKWEESCDEAEKLCIYRSAWMAYKAVNSTCLILFLLCVAGMAVFDFGIVPVFIVGIIWFVSILTYMINAVKL